MGQRPNLLRDEIDPVVRDVRTHLRGELARRQRRVLADAALRQRPEEVAVEIHRRRLLEARGGCGNGGGLSGCMRD